MTTNADLIFAPRTLLAAVLKMHVPTMYLRATFFPYGEQVQTLHIELDDVVGNKKKGSYVGPNHKTVFVQKQTMENMIWQPALVNIGTQISAYEAALHRNPGETVYNDSDVVQRASESIGIELSNLNNMISRSEEQMCSEILKTGKVHILGDGVDRTIDFRMPVSHLITLDNNNVFTNSNADPISILDNICTTVERNVNNPLGPPDIAVLGRNVAKAFLTHAKVTGSDSKINGFKNELGTIAPNDSENKVRYIGTLKAMNSLNIFWYRETYQDPVTDIVHDMVDPDYIYLGNSKVSNRFVHAAVPDLDAGKANIDDLVRVNSNGKSTYVATSRYPKTWREPNPSAQMLSLQSSFLALQLYPASFASIKAV